MMRTKMRRVFAVLTGMLFSFGALASPDLGNISGVVGGKFMDKDDWSPAQNQFEFGGEASYQPANWPLGFAAAYFSSHGKGSYEGSELHLSTSEVQLGLTKIWDIRRVGQPFVSGGVALGRLDASLETVHDTDHAVGGWIGGGFTFVLARHLALGIENRFSYIPVHLEGHTYKGGGDHILATLGFAW